MAASTTLHPHIHRPAISRERLANGWPHRVAAGLLVMIGAGFVTYTAIKLLNGKARTLSPMVYVAAAAFVLYFALPLIERVAR